MSEKNELARGRIIQTLINTLEPLEYVHALYEGGAQAFGRLDEWSDIDLYAVVDDNKVDQTFEAIEEALNKVSPIEKKYPVLQQPWPGIFQAFYRLKNTSKYTLIDFAILQISNKEKFLEPKIHGNNVFYFNKPPKITPTPFDANSFDENMSKKKERLKTRFDMFNSFVQKEINRGNSLEAIDIYHNVTLASLVEALRIKYNPLHYDFKMRYVHYELPSHIVRRLRYLYFVKNLKELQVKYEEATKWFLETTSLVSTMKR